MEKVLKTFKLSDIQIKELKSQYLSALEGLNSFNYRFDKVDPKQFCEIVKFSDERVCLGFVKHGGLNRLTRLSVLALECIENVKFIYQMGNELTDEEIIEYEVDLIGFENSDGIFFDMQIIF